MTTRNKFDDEYYPHGFSPNIPVWHLERQNGTPEFNGDNTLPQNITMIDGSSVLPAPNQTTKTFDFKDKIQPGVRILCLDSALEQSQINKIRTVTRIAGSYYYWIVAGKVREFRARIPGKNRFRQVSDGTVVVFGRDGTERLRFL